MRTEVRITSAGNCTRAVSKYVPMMGCPKRLIGIRRLFCLFQNLGDDVFLNDLGAPGNVSHLGSLCGTFQYS